MSDSILVVEDNSDLSLLFQLVLESAGYQVATIDNGRDALTQIEEIDPQLIVMDIMMPEISGLEVARQIKERPDYQSLPILLVSAVDRLKEEQIAESKADAIIYKPFDLDYLISRVDRMTSDCLESKNQNHYSKIAVS
ncbi:response regulator [Pleurocapsales cyanobacterium LEGE 10410]|nr:response regulator [Pleurocapsales cyanobacterium LEGE 10410]